jgi:lipoate synthase
MLTVAFALVSGYFGDIQATLAPAYKLCVILRNSGLGELSEEVQDVLKVLHTFHEDTAALMQYLENDSPLT